MRLGILKKYAGLWWLGGLESGRPRLQTMGELLQIFQI